MCPKILTPIQNHPAQARDRDHDQAPGLVQDQDHAQDQDQAEKEEKEEKVAAILTEEDILVSNVKAKTEKTGAEVREGVRANTREAEAIHLPVISHAIQMGLTHPRSQYDPSLKTPTLTIPILRFSRSLQDSRLSI